MTMRFHTPTRLELKLPLTVIEHCWFMNMESELCLSALSANSARINIFLEKSKDHMKFHFTACEGVPFFELLSDVCSCSIDTISENRTVLESSNWLRVSTQNLRTQLNLRPHFKPSAKQDLRPDSKKSRGSVAFCDVQLQQSLEHTGEEPGSDVIHIKDECVETPDLNESMTGPFDRSLGFYSARIEEEGVGFVRDVSEANGSTDSEDRTDASSLSSDAREGRRDLQYSDGFQQNLEQGKIQKRSLKGSQRNAKVRKPKPKFSKQGTCPYCDVYYGNLSQHMITYCTKNPERKRVFHCCYCKVKFRSKDELLEHKTSHVLLREFKCETCDSAFFTRQRLIRHMRYVHLVGNNPVKIYSCDTCDKRFRYRSHYDRHLTIHQEEKSVQCEMCGKFFKNKHNVHNHQSRMHQLKSLQATYPYYCEKCGEGFLHLGAHRCSEPRQPRVRNTTLDSTSSQDQDVLSQTRDEGATAVPENEPISAVPDS